MRSQLHLLKPYVSFPPSTLVALDKWETLKVFPLWNFHYANRTTPIVQTAGLALGAGNWKVRQQTLRE